MSTWTKSITLNLNLDYDITLVSKPLETFPTYIKRIPSLSFVTQDVPSDVVFFLEYPGVFQGGRPPVLNT